MRFRRLIFYFNLFLGITSFISKCFNWKLTIQLHIAESIEITLCIYILIHTNYKL